MPETNPVPRYEEPKFDLTEEQIRESEQRYRVFEENGGKMTRGDFEAWEANQDRFSEEKARQAKKKTLKSGDQTVH